jgi:hypothetical protein
VLLDRYRVSGADFGMRGCAGRSHRSKTQALCLNLLRPSFAPSSAFKLPTFDECVEQLDELFLVAALGKQTESFNITLGCQMLRKVAVDQKVRIFGSMSSKTFCLNACAWPKIYVNVKNVLNRRCRLLNL